MPELGLALYVVYLVVVFLGRALMLRSRTGTAGWHGVSGRPGSASWWGGVLFAVALVGGLAGAALGAAGVVDSAGGGRIHALGLVLFAAGLAGSMAAQAAMGASWRVGAAEQERTELVASGLFGLARNPFFTALMVASLGLALLIANVVVALSLLALIVAIELQVRVVEEPYLARAHGPRYVRYATRVGRFVPGVGRLGEGG